MDLIAVVEMTCLLKLRMRSAYIFETVKLQAS